MLSPRWHKILGDLRSHKVRTAVVVLSIAVGVFEGEDTFEGRPIRVRFTWTGVTTETPHWEQAFSEDGGETWETNWVMDFTPAGNGR